MICCSNHAIRLLFFVKYLPTLKDKKQVEGGEEGGGEGGEEGREGRRGGEERCKRYL